MPKKAKYTSEQLRAQYPIFTYLKYNWQLIDHDDGQCDLELTFVYTLGDSYTFTHHVTLYQVERQHLERQQAGLIDNLAFHLGIVEGFSYWKLTASPQYVIAAGSLSSRQLQYWHEWLINGMSEYFYVNQINFTAPDFVTITNAQPKPEERGWTTYHLRPSHQGRHSLVNLGGGKDSAVMLDLLGKAGEKCGAFIIAPNSPAAETQATLASLPIHRARRVFDPQLRQLNDQGFLNGHVPFSASVAFIDLLAMVAYDYNYALVGNEASADEVSLTWLDQPINHQYSKSTKFERSFFEYRREYLINRVEYFSFLRIFNEFQIAHIFCSNPKYWTVTRSCNRGQRQNIWCHQCAKCLFVYLLLAAHLPLKTVASDIFDHDLLDDERLAPLLEELLGLRPSKPLECVGTREECQVAFYLVYTKCVQESQPLPKLIARYYRQILLLHNDWLSLVDKLYTFFNYQAFKQSEMAQLRTVPAPCHFLMADWAVPIVLAAHEQVLHDSYEILKNLYEEQLPKVKSKKDGDV